MRTYREALAFLDQFANFELTRSVAYGPGTFELARLERLLDGLGRPQAQYRVVHVAGTKGKGSTCALIESALRAAGYRTGLYISPHLHTIRERIRVSGAMIEPDETAALVDEIEPHLAQAPGLTYFEILTALGFLYFARRRVDVAVIEVGLGGRLDATNVVSPMVSVITSISFDHMAWLGNTLGQIAAEKAGIIKPGTPVVSAPQKPEAQQAIEETAARQAAPLTLVGRDWVVTPGPISLDGQSFARLRPEWYANFEPVPEFYWIPLLGRHQIVNAALALATLDVLRDQGVELPAEAVAQGLRSVQWPGRMQVLSRDPLVVVDGAHNGESAQRIRAALAEWFPGRRWTLVFGASSDKDLGAMLDELLPAAERVILTRARLSRAAEPEALRELVIGLRPAEIMRSVPQALDQALHVASGSGEGILVTGSLFVTAEAIEAWLARTGGPAPETDES